MTPATADRVEVLVVCSSGGHLFDALAISRAWSGRRSAWVSFDKTDVRSLLAAERVYYAYGPTNRSVVNLLRNLGRAWRVVRATRPGVLVSTGAGVGVPFAWVARLFGARVVYVECAGRVDRPSLSGRLIAPVASHIYAQWPDLAAGWRRARYAGNVLLAPGRRRVPSTAGSGVFVTVGTNEAPFDRLVRAAGNLPDDRVVVQHGASNVRAAGAQSFDFTSFAEIDALMQSARVVVCHAGIGSVAAAHSHGHRPIVVPRLHRLGEAVDDHQLFFARQLEAAGLATVVEDVEKLPGIVAGASSTAIAESGPDLAAEIESVLDTILRGDEVRSQAGVSDLGGRYSRIGRSGP